MAKKRVTITLNEETKNKILEWGNKNKIPGGLSAAIEGMAATSLEEKKEEAPKKEEKPKQEENEPVQTVTDEKIQETCAEIDNHLFAIGCAAVATGVCIAIGKVLFRH